MKGVPGKYIKSKPVPGLLHLTLNGYTAAHQFTVPNDDNPPQTAVNDTRNTLLWKPDLITAEDGKATFSFYTSNEKGKYRIILEGLAANGEICRKTSYYEVN